MANVAVFLSHGKKSQCQSHKSNCMCTAQCTAENREENTRKIDVKTEKTNR